MARDLNLDAEIVVCPIVRENDGLALSSRNAYLNADERRAATVLYRALQAAQAEAANGVRSSLRLQEAMHTVLSSEPLARVDYAEIVDAETFEPVARIAHKSYALLAVYLGKTRLIDNMLMEALGDEIKTEL
jgi:pantoate--beta-alanine ligase